MYHSDFLFFINFGTTYDNKYADLHAKTKKMKKQVLNITLILIFTLFAINTYADGTKGLKKNKNSKISTENIINRAQVKVESVISFESWMLDIDEFQKDVFLEDELVIEDWMTENFITEGEIQMEDWMQDISSFSNAECEEELDLEVWMTKIFI